MFDAVQDTSYNHLTFINYFIHNQIVKIMAVDSVWIKTHKVLNNFFAELTCKKWYVNKYNIITKNIKN